MKKAIWLPNEIKVRIKELKKAGYSINKTDRGISAQTFEGEVVLIIRNNIAEYKEGLFGNEDNPYEVNNYPGNVKEVKRCLL